MDSLVNERNDITGNFRKILYIIVFLPCLMVFAGGLDNDIWFLLNHGKTVIENGFPTIEPYTIHSGFKFVMQQWLSAVIFYMVYVWFGELGLQILVFLFYVITVILFFKLCMSISQRYFFLSYVITLIFSVMLSFFMVARPYIFTTLIYVLEIWILEKYTVDKENKVLIILPILSLLMINLAASVWPMLFVILFPYILDSFNFRIGSLNFSNYPTCPLFVCSIFMLIFGFVNPYGTDAMTYLFRSFGVPEINSVVGEMHYLSVDSNLGKIMLSLIFIVFLLFTFSLFQKKIMNVRYVLLMLGTAYLSMTAIRGFQFFAICGFFPISFLYKDIKIPVYTNTHPRRTKILRVTLLLLLLCGIFYIPFKYADLFKSTISKKNLQLQEIIDLVDKKNSKDLVVYTGYNDGGLAEFNGIPVYLDSRAEVFIKKNNLKEDVLKEYYDLQTGKLYYKNFINKYHFTHIIVSEMDILYTYLPFDYDYKLIYKNESYHLYKLRQ